jgi:uncharacterized protein
VIVVDGNVFRCTRDMPWENHHNRFGAIGDFIPQSKSFEFLKDEEDLISMSIQYNFEWDLNKSKTNREKHKVSFESAATVFKDEKAITIYDDDHSENEERWITLGTAENGLLLVVYHTFKQIDKAVVNIRIISSRKATKNEIKQYLEP